MIDQIESNQIKLLYAVGSMMIVVDDEWSFYGGWGGGGWGGGNVSDWTGRVE